MALKDLITADVAVFLNTDEFARSVVYRSAQGSESTVTAVVYESVAGQESNNGLTTIVRTLAITFAATNTFIDSTGTVLIDGQEWAVTPEITTDGTLTSAILKRFELHEQSRPNLRRT
jgi:hypothetical protein